MLLAGAGAVSAISLHAVEKRVQFCVGVTGELCMPGILECCDSAGTCTRDQDGIPVSAEFNKAIVKKMLNLLSSQTCQSDDD